VRRALYHSAYQRHGISPPDTPASCAEVFYARRAARRRLAALAGVALLLALLAQVALR
jgi:hypothetical protein